MKKITRNYLRKLILKEMSMGMQHNPDPNMLADKLEQSYRDDTEGFQAGEKFEDRAAWATFNNGQNVEAVVAEFMDELGVNDDIGTNDPPFDMIRKRAVDAFTSEDISGLTGDAPQLQGLLGDTGDLDGPEDDAAELRDIADAIDSGRINEGSRQSRSNRVMLRNMIRQAILNTGRK